jgi:Tol biopolymer transport system component
VDAEGGDSNGYSESPSMSATGRYVAFGSEAGDLVQGDGNGWGDIFVRDLTAGTTVRASVNTEGGDPNGASHQPSISADGRHIAFYSYAGNLEPGRGDPGSDMFVARWG